MSSLSRVLFLLCSCIFCKRTGYKPTGPAFSDFRGVAFVTFLACPGHPAEARRWKFLGFWQSISGLGKLVGIVQKVFSPKGVPRIFDACLTQFWRISDAFWTFLFPNKTRPILTHFWRIFDAFLTHFWRILAICRRLFRKHLLDDTELVGILSKNLLRPKIAIPAAIYRSAFRARAWKCPTECFLSNFGHLPQSAPKSAFKVLFGLF